MRNKTKLPSFYVNLHYVKIEGVAELIESPYYDHYELCNDLGYVPMNFSWRVTNKDAYKQIQPKLKDIENHLHTGQRLMKYKSLRKKIKDFQKEGFFPNLEYIKENKQIKTK
tara:strand:+ start:62 stop:397 length:336 start_codon:yes stop_codon:yes gene_type:complete